MHETFFRLALRLSDLIKRHRFRDGNCKTAACNVISDERPVICSEWMAPTTAYEVEFRSTAGFVHATRALLLGNQIQITDPAN